jgi:capsid portal protein
MLDKIEFQDPEGEDEISVWFADDNGNLYNEQDVISSVVSASEKYPEKFEQSNELLNSVQKVQKSLKKKGFEGSTQDQSEIRQGTSFVADDIIDPPYPPQCFADFLEVDETLFRCVATKVMDSVCREYLIESNKPVRTYSDQVTPDIADDDDDFVEKSIFSSEREQIEEFIRSCNRIHGFRGVLKKVAMDHESIGWGAVEVIRSADYRIKRIEHVPATRLKVLKGWYGFIEEREEGNHTYYQVFGEKVLKKSDDLGIPSLDRHYDPKTDGELGIGNTNIQWNLMDRVTGMPTSDFSKSANEILYFPRSHSNTIYYGYTDSVPAIGAILANSYIRDYLNQFFEHNTVPRYAVVVKGMAIDDDFRKMISSYFSENIKGAAHKTMILTLNSKGNKTVEIEFIPLDTEHKEGDFLNTRREQAQQIMTAHGLSPALLGIVNNSELGSGKGLSQAEIYKDRIVTPSQDFYEDKLNYMFRLGLGVIYAELHFNPLDIRDELTQAQATQMFSNMGSMTINEIRATMKLGPIPGGDVAFVRIRDGSAFKVQDLPNLPSNVKGATPRGPEPEE